MKHKENTWGWMLAADFFFAGMGGGVLLIAGIIELFIGEGRTSLLGNFLAPACIAAGAGLLILELGRPFQAFRVFLNPKAILTIGAWSMLMAIGFGFVYASFGIETLPWSGWIVVRKVAAGLMAVFGLVVATYPGILLGRHKARPSWTGIGIMILFLTSSLVTGTAGLVLSSLVVAPAVPGIESGLAFLGAGLLGVQLIFWPAYLWIKASGTTQREAAAVQRWIKGQFSGAFMIGIMVAGTAAPLILFLIPGEASRAVGAVLVLIGGLLVRLLVVYSGEERTWLPGEEKYRSRLPLGDEAFMKAWKSK